MEPQNSDIVRGVKTSEFWVAIAPIALAMVERNNTDLIKLMVICSTFMGVAYIVSRTFVKCNKNHE